MRQRFVASVAAIAPLLIAAAEPVKLQPSSPWDLDYAENSCRLLRAFGVGPDKTILMFESDGPGNMDMLVIGKPVAANRDEVSATFLPLQGIPITGRPAKSAETGEPAILWPDVVLLSKETITRIVKEWHKHVIPVGVRPPPLDLAEIARRKAERQAFAASTTELVIEAKQWRSVILETGSLGEAVGMFDECSQESLRDWGVDPELDARIVRRAWPTNRSKWLSDKDYPHAMLAAGEQSEVRVRLLVDATGKVTKCTSLTHYRAPGFDQIVCDAMMRRARFEPAELADGTKVPSYYTDRVRFRAY